MKKIKPPFLSTSFSESGKKAKLRIENILSSKVKRVGSMLIAGLVLSAGAAGAVVSIEKNLFYEPFVGCEKTIYDLSSTVIINDGPAWLWSCRHKNLDRIEADEEHNIVIDSLLEMHRYLGSFATENRAESRPCGRIYWFETPFELMGENRSNEIMKNCAIILMSLIEDLDYVEWSYPTLSGGEKSMRLSMEEACDIAGGNIKFVDEESDIYGLIRLTELYRNQGKLGYYTVSEIDRFEDEAFIIANDDIENEQVLTDFLRAAEHRVPSELKVAVKGENIGILETDGYTFRFTCWDYEQLYSSKEYNNLQIVRTGARADFYLTGIDNFYWTSSDEDEPYLLFSIEKGDKHNEKTY